MRFVSAPLGRPFIFGMFAAYTALTIFILGASATTTVGATFWMLGYVWNAYFWLLRFPMKMRLDTVELTWAAPLRHGTVRVSDITQVRPMRVVFNLAIIGVRDSRAVIVPVTKGFKAFAEELASLRPDLEIRLGIQSRMAEKLPGRDRCVELPPRLE